MKPTSAISVVAAVLLASATWAGSEASMTDRVQQLTTGESYQVAQTCSGAGSKYCYPGSIAGGGCYNPSYSRCWEGMICPNGFRICTVDQKGYPTPYCYEPSKPNTCRE